MARTINLNQEVVRTRMGEEPPQDQEPVPQVPQPTYVIGFSIRRPTGLVANSIMYEKDTGNRMRFVGLDEDGSDKWELIDNLWNR